MGEARTFLMRVPFGPAGHFLGQGPDGRIEAVPAKVPFEDGLITNPAILVFRFKAERTMRDDMKIERRADEINGDPGLTADLALGLDTAVQAARAEIERQLWPEGRPSVTGEEAKAQEAKIAAAFGEHPDKGKIDRMMWLQSRQDCAACWAVLIEAPPTGWEDIIDKPLRPAVMNAIVNAWVEARSKADQGK
jgi:hypothetical protein